jgi:hypothetical protein
MNKTIRLITNSGRIMVLTGVTSIDCDEVYMRFRGAGFESRVFTSDMSNGLIKIHTEGE